MAVVLDDGGNEFELDVAGVQTGFGAKEGPGLGHVAGDAAGALRLPLAHAAQQAMAREGQTPK